MGRPRTDLQDLELKGSRDLARAKSRPALPALVHRDVLEDMFTCLLERRASLVADIEANGFKIKEERFSRGKLYWALVPNPALSALQTTERQIVAVCKVLSSPAFRNANTPGKLSDEELLALVHGSN